MKKKSLLTALLNISLVFSAISAITPSVSFYKAKLNDPEAVYFTPQNFDITTDGKTDVSDALQGAINKLKSEDQFGIVFIPEGIYTITKTIYIPRAIRLIGYGKTRPLFVLKKNSPGYQLPNISDGVRSNYVFWFTNTIVDSKETMNDAGPGTFYSALSNIDIKIEDGNPEAVALRTHYAQHSFISHCDIFTGNGKAGMLDVGNFMEDVRFFGGDYGIITGKTSPAWPFVMLDSYFDGQRKSAIRTREAGLTIIRMTARNVPKVIEVDPSYYEKLFMEDCQFVNVSGSVIDFEDTNQASMQINLKNIACQNAPVVINYATSKTQLSAPGTIYNIKKYTDGLQMSDLDADPKNEITVDMENLKKLPPTVPTDIPTLPAMDTWVNLRELGAKGDGITDDTKIILEAVDKYSTIYVPQGVYRISETIKLKNNTVLIGLHPMSTNFVIGESTPAFSGFGTPKPMIESPQGGRNSITGIGLNTGEYNYRAVACKWMSGENSLVDDVKFIGGSGTMAKGPNTISNNESKKSRPNPGFDPAWDTQYWNFWITNGGGGIFKNIWTASPYSNLGIYISNTSTVSRIYALSVEHHVRNEIRFNNVSNWKVYALQLEEENLESPDCLPVEMSNCNNLVFANTYMYRVSRMKTPYPYAIRTWNCKNIEMLNLHNYSQTKYSFENAIYDINTNTDVRPWEFARLNISGNSPKNRLSESTNPVKVLAQGFEFAEGACADSRGNVYFSEQRLKRIFKWSAETNQLSLVADFQWQPLSLGCDTKDNLLVVFRYNPQPGLLIDGKQEEFSRPLDGRGTSYGSSRGNSGFGIFVYSIDPNNPDETIQLLKKVPMNSATNVYKALYPAGRYRDSNDFSKIIVNRNEECFVAPDGVTIIPVCFDLARQSSLIEAFPGKPHYVAHEVYKNTVRLDVDAGGYLSNPIRFAEKGEFSSITDKQGNVYIADGQIYVFDKTGKQTGIIKMPERPNTITFGGKDKDILFVTSRNALFSVNINSIR